MKAILSTIYRLLAPGGLFPPVIGEMELWQVGVLTGADKPMPGPRIIIPRGPIDSANLPSGPRLAEVD